MKRMIKAVKCSLCGAELDKIAVGLNKKLIGKKVTRLFCLFCLAGHLDVTIEELIEKVDEFREQGCTLF